MPRTFARATPTLHARIAARIETQRIFGHDVDTRIERPELASAIDTVMQTCSERQLNALSFILAQCAKRES